MSIEEHSIPTSQSQSTTQTNTWVDEYQNTHNDILVDNLNKPIVELEYTEDIVRSPPTIKNSKRSSLLLENNTFSNTENGFTTGLAQLEANSLFTGVARHSFKTRSGTRNFAINPIFDEQPF